MIKMKTLTYYWRNELLLVSLRIFLLRYMIGLGFCTCLCYVLKLCLSDLCSSTQCDRICSFCHTLRRIISWNNMFFPNNILPTELCSFRWETVSSEDQWWGTCSCTCLWICFLFLFLLENDPGKKCSHLLHSQNNQKHSLHFKKKKLFD